MNNFNLLFNNSLHNRIYTKSFLMTVGLMFITPIIIILLMFNFLFKDQSDFEIGIYTQLDSDIVLTDDLNYSYKQVDTLDNNLDSEDQYQYAMIYDLDKNIIYNYNDQIHEQNKIEEEISQIAIANNPNITQSEFENIDQYNDIEVKEVGDKVTNQQMFRSFKLIISLVVFAIGIFAMSLVGIEIAEEKSSRAIEIIISNSSVLSHFISKILATFIYLILMGVTLFAGLMTAILLSLRIFRDQIINMAISNQDIVQTSNVNIDTNDLIFTLIISIILVSISLLIYLFIAAMIASFSTSESNFQTLLVPITNILLVGYLLSIFQLSDLLTKFLALIPGLSIFFIPNLFANPSIDSIFYIIIIIDNLLFLFLITYIIKKTYKEALLSNQGINFQKFKQKLFR